MADPRSTTAHGRYEELKAAREPYLRRAREVASVTLPYMFPPEGASGDTGLPTPFQSVGARGVNNLAAKLLLALFPPNTPFFELGVDDYALSEMEQGGDESLRAKVSLALSSITRAVVDRFEDRKGRNKMFDLLKNLIVGGNGLLEFLPDDNIRVHPLTSYVCQRDGEGTPVDIILKEEISRRTAPPEILELLDEETQIQPEDESSEDVINLYTWIKRNPSEKKWEVHQEVGDNDKRVPDSEGTYPLDRSAFVPQRFISVEGEDYGRGYGEEYLGDLISLETNSRSIVDFSAAASRIVNFIDPGGITDEEEFTKASSGETIEGSADDVTTYALEKFMDFQVADAVSSRMEKRLAQAFLLYSSVQRDAERVTAEEIRLLANELEEALGGVYSLLASELQEPLVRRLMHQMTRREDIPRLPMDDINLKVVTGVAALGRNHELVKIDTFIRGMMELSDGMALDYINFGDLFQRRAAAINLPIKGLIRTEEEVTRIRQQRQAAEAATKAAPQMAQYLDHRASEANENQPTQE